MRKIGRGVDERAVEINGDQLESKHSGCKQRLSVGAAYSRDENKKSRQDTAPTLQNTRTAISAGAASKSSSSSSKRSNVSDAPAISSDVQYSPT